MEMDKLPEISIENEMKKSYLDYAMSVIIGRALPDVRDGLKPVHRRVLYAMRELKNDWNKPYKKSARIVGDVIGKYHPHGDSAVYDTIVRMAQHFSLRYPMVDGQGNFGSVDGDPPAAMRYTEVRMQRIAHQMLEDLDKETVDWTPNYDESLLEPSVLPAKVPHLLVNGSAGIAVGMATNIPPHNLMEVADAVKAVIDRPEIGDRELLELVPGPDFPTAGLIYGKQGIVDAYRTGKGIIRIRARISIEKDEQHGYDTIAVTELPYQVNKARLIEKIAELIRHKQLEGVKFIRDESDRRGMRIAIGLKRDQIAEVIINQLYKHTQLETSFGIIFLAVVDGRPELLCLRDIIDHFIYHRKDIIVRRTRYDLKKAEARAHILEGLKIALDHLDDVVALIRSAASPAEAKSGLMSRFGFTDVQAQSILDMRLQRLTGLERQKIRDEYESVLKDIQHFKEILSSERMILEIIQKEMSELQEGFGDARRTEIVEETREITIEDMIAEEDMVVSITHAGYIKRNPITLYQSQRRGGKGKTAMVTRDQDFVRHIFVASTHDTFLFFTNLGKVYWLKVYEIPKVGRTGRGKALVNLLDFSEGEKLTTVLEVSSFEPGAFILMATRNGMVKKTDLMAYSRPMSGGIIALDLSAGDELMAARITDGTHNVFLGTLLGKAIRFHESEARPMGRVTRGVRGIRMDKSDRLVGMEVMRHGETLFTVTEHGYGKRTSIDEYPVRKRGGKGVITIKTNERNGPVAAISLADEREDVMLMTDTGRLIRFPVGSVSVISRNTLGVKLIDLEPDERVIGLARLSEKEADVADQVQEEGEGTA